MAEPATGPDAPAPPPAPSTDIKWKLKDWPPHVDVKTNKQFNRLRNTVTLVLLVILAFLAASLGTVVNGNVFKRRVWGPAFFPGATASDGYVLLKCVWGVGGGGWGVGGGGEGGEGEGRRMLSRKVVWCSPTPPPCAN